MMKGFNKALKKAFSYVLVAAMSVGSLSHGGTLHNVVAKEGSMHLVPKMEADGDVTFFYQGDGSESEIYVKGSWVSDWSDYHYFSETDPETHVWSVTVDLNADTDYEYGIVVDDNWVGDPQNPWAGSNSKIVRNPKVSTDSVATFYYYPAVDENASDITLCYKETGTEEYQTVVFATDDIAANVFSAKTDVLNGTYEYEIRVNGEAVTDYNSAGNVFTVKSIPQADPTVVSPVVNANEVTFSYYAPLAKEVYLAGSMNEWNAGACLMDYDETSGYWTKTLTLNKGSYQYKYVVDGNWEADPLNPVTDWGNSVVEVTEQTGEDEEPETPEVTAAYTYHIYYYKQNLTNASDAALWIWNYGVGAGSEYPFDHTEVIDGNTWLVADLGLDYEDLGVIPKSPGSWSWQEADHVFHHTAGQSEATIYLVAEDDAVYTSVPDLSSKEPERVVLLEYVRPAGDYEGWNIYTWDNGYSNTDYYFEEINGKYVCAVPVKDSKEGFSFCMRHSVGDNIWESKDGGDHFASIPLGQKVTKVLFVQDQGVVSMLPLNVDYEMNPVEKTVTFYYRDENLFRAYNEEALIGKVFVIVDGESYEMNYAPEREQYVFDWTKLVGGVHTYSYLVDGAAGEEKTFEYITFDASVEAELSLNEMNYRQNAVLSFEMAGETQGFEVAEAYADLTELGLSEHFAISPKLQAVTISVKENVVAGEKTIPVFVKDQYGNRYETAVSVKVVPVKDKDFDWDESVIYFTVTDRFFNGNTSNDDAYGIGDYNTSEKGSLSYHGGDFAGLTQKLDYLQKLGVNTVWVTPIVENECDGLTTDLAGVKSYGYHGYWATDFTKLNAHLGTEEEFAVLVDELHKRGMKIMVDVVLNHAGYGSEEYFNSQLEKNMVRDASNTVSGDTVLDGLAGLPDFVTEDPEVRNLLIAWQTQWVKDYDIDYFRVDTVKHVENTTWMAFKNALTLIDPEFKMIGEYSGAGFANDFGSLKSGQMDSLLDFDFNDKAQAFVTGNITEVEDYLEKRNAAIDNTAMMGQFMSSHDEDGLQYKLIHQNNISASKAYDLMKAASALQLTMKGQPVIYYGEEVGQTGADNYPYQTNRYDFDWSAVENGSDMLTHYQKLLAIRNDYTDIFAKGSRTCIDADEAEQYLVFERSYENDSLYVGISLNETKKQVNVKTNEKVGTALVDLYHNVHYVVGEDQTVTVELPAVSDGGVVILAKEEYQPWDGKTTQSVYEGDGFRVIFTLNGVWNGGYNAGVKIVNTGSVSIDNWALSMNLPGEMKQIWNAKILEQDTNSYSLKNVEWNQNIKPGRSVEFGFIGKEDFQAFPTRYALLGGKHEVTSDVKVSYEICSDWGCGFMGTITITNTSNKAIEDWSLEMDYDRNMVSIWNGVTTSYQKGHYMISNAVYNANIPAGGSVTIGFIGAGGNRNDKPKKIAVYSFS